MVNRVSFPRNVNLRAGHQRKTIDVGAIVRRGYIKTKMATGNDVFLFPSALKS